MKRRAPHRFTHTAKQQARRVEALTAKVEKMRARSTWWRRLICRAFSHRPWSTGLTGRASTGAVYALHVCQRCGARIVNELAELPASPPALRVVK